MPLRGSDTQPLTGDLFAPQALPARQRLADGAFVLSRFAIDAAPGLLKEIECIAAAAPFRHWRTPGGLRMSVAMTSCGQFGWVSDEKGYRYEPCDPLSGQPWPSMPAAFSALAESAAQFTGFSQFAPDACLINRYEPGTRLTLHQDKDERDFSAPVVSVSLGLPAVFLFGGLLRTDKQIRVALHHGDVVVWGGPSRLYYHGVKPLKAGEHFLLGERRLNLTFRRAG